ncbi:MAG: zinc ribbon domain-containing protein [Bryobacteraceae bacterium]
MPERCTCGAQLPPDALFCHRCGKPQREDLIQREELLERAEEMIAQDPADAFAPPPLPPTAPLPIGLKNVVAVRVALFAGVLCLVASMLLGQVPGLQVLAMLAPAASGFLAVHLYRKRTGQHLSMASGARLGWISGLFGFILITILFTIFSVMLSQPELADAIRQQAEQRNRPEMMQVMEEFRSPEALAKTLAATFLIFTLLPAFGGTLGAKFLNRDSR